jgi:hypothetical protein
MDGGSVVFGLKICLKGRSRSQISLSNTKDRSGSKCILRDFLYSSQGELNPGKIFSFFVHISSSSSSLTVVVSADLSLRSFWLRKVEKKKGNGWLALDELPA